MFHKFMTATLAAMALSACNPLENLEVAEQRVESFEQAYSSENVDRLWRMTGKQFREVTTKEEFADFNLVFNTRLGAIESSERSNFNVNTNNGVTRTVVVMDTVFEQGEGVQIYMFEGHGDDMQLLGWKVNSPLLAVTADDLQPGE